ncbi:MAG: Mur ligase family protein [bacterium]|nr:Mur ligase family protein [bacterium]
MEQITYQEATAYLLSVPKFTGKHTMEDTRRFYQFMGSPCADARIIHVAGTNGKGSVCTYLRSMLERCAHHTALFVSPHLVTMRERFLFDGKPVSEEAFCASFAAVAEALCAYQGRKDAVSLETLRGLSYHPSFFEMLFFMFLQCRETAKADDVILETGLGGRLDATNCMPKKALCVITRIALDHTEYLGDTTAQIAREKAGIFRQGTPVVSLYSDKESKEVIEACAKEWNAPLVFVDSRDFKIEGITNKSIAFSFQSVYYNSISLSLATTACYQAENAALALRALEVLSQGAAWKKKNAAEQEAAAGAEEAFGLAAHPAERELREGLAAARWEGRMEEVLPEVYLDGAHNEDGIRALLHTVRRTGQDRVNVLILAIVADKRYERMAELIARSGLFLRVYVTSAGGERALAQEALAGALISYGQRNCMVYEQPEQAFSCCLAERKDTERVFAAGSLYLIGRIKAYLGRNSDD